MIRIQDLTVRAGTFALEAVSLEVASEEYFVLLGPTGSGKSLLLKCLSGLIRARSGRVSIDGEEITHWEPRRRRIGYVPQDYGLFPHLTAEENVIFSLRARGFSRRAATREVAPLVDMLSLGPILRRHPASLSGGERQKVALARALAGRPRLLLLDEPVSALDAPTRLGVSAELRGIQRALRVPTIHVSHSVDEALAVSDRAGILDRGRLVETGRLEDLLARPRTLAGARLLHDENLLAGCATPAGAFRSKVVVAGREFLAPGRHEGRVWLLVRPEALAFAAAGGEGQRGERGVSEVSRIRARLIGIEERRGYRRLAFDAGFPLAAYAAPSARGLAAAGLEVGAEYLVEVPVEAVWVIPEP
ncbi:MAG: ABC transporter ATP-binding protein [Planctomycetota bacterium]